MRCNGKEVRTERESLFMDQTVCLVYGKGLLLISALFSLNHSNENEVKTHL